MSSEPTEEVSSTKTRGRWWRSRWLWGVVVLLAVAVGGKVIHRAMQPKFLDKTVEEWFAEYTIDDMLGHEVHNRPFQELGTDAAWFLWGELTRKDSKATAWLMAQKDKLTGKKRSMFGRTNEEERRNKASHLIVRLGPATEVLIPGMLARLKVADPDEAAFMAYLLGEIRRQPEVVVPAIHLSLLSTNWNLEHRISHFKALGKFGPKAIASVPDLQSRLANPVYTNKGENLFLAQTILLINGPGPELGVFTNRLVPGDIHKSISGISFLQRVGTNGRSAVPVLREFAKSLNNEGDIWIVTNAIHKIDPEGIYSRP